MKEIQRFTKFVYNHPHNFIEQCWIDDNRVMNHLKTSFLSRTRQYGAVHGFLSWYMNLAEHNQEILINWILENCVNHDKN